MKHRIFFQQIKSCVGECSGAIEERERVCSSNSSCLLRLYYPCYNKSACADSCTGICTGEWIRTGMGQCPVFCDGGNRTVQYTCRDQSKKMFVFFQAKNMLRFSITPDFATLR